MPVHLRELLAQPAGVREDNRSKLLRALMINPDNQANLSKRAGLSAGTVSEAVGELVGQGVVTSERIGRETSVRMAKTAGIVVGIEGGRQTATVVARRVDQEYLDSAARQVRVGVSRGLQIWVPAVVQAVREVVDDLEQEEVAAVGLAVPWMIDPQMGTLVPPALPPWKEGDDPAAQLADGLREELGAQFTAPKVVLDNDANLLAYAESLYGTPSGETLIGIKASTGIGAGIIIGGNIFRGMCGVAGELGHTSLQADGRFCVCGGRGCLETLVGAEVLVEQAKVALGGQRKLAPANFDELVAAAVRGSLTCQRVLYEAARTLGVALGNLCSVLNPNVVVLGGTLGQDEAARYTLDACREGISRTAMRAAVSEQSGFTLRARQVRHAASHGAVAMALQGTVYRT
jgi:predicted NBD/HSP70 family sugar kinase